MSIETLKAESLTGPVYLKSDLCAAKPIYIFFEGERAYKSENLKEILKKVKESGRLEVDTRSLSFLLQSGVVPPPATIFKNLYIVGIGDTGTLKVKDGQISLDVTHDFPFLSWKKNHENPVDFDQILDIVGEAVTSPLGKKPGYLFHSAGKDSNLVALGVAKGGLQDQVTFVSHESKGAADESKISKGIADKLGFKHITLKEVDRLDHGHIDHIIEYFTEIPFPATDNVSLAFPLYSFQIPELFDSTVISGDGNDSYMGTPPSKRDILTRKFSPLLSSIRGIGLPLGSAGVMNPISKTAIEWFRMDGLNFYETRRLLEGATNVYPLWAEEVSKRSKWGETDFKTDLFYTNSVAEMHLRKMRNAADFWRSQLILPLADQKVAEYFWSLKKECLLDEKNLKNKVVLRELLKERLDLDSDKLGKKGYSYDSITFLVENWKWIEAEILACIWWDRTEAEKILKKLKKQFGYKSITERLAARIIYRLFLLSSWLNHSKYLKK